MTSNNNCLSCTYGSLGLDDCSCARALLPEGRMVSIGLDKVPLTCPCHSDRDAEKNVSFWVDDGLFKPEMEVYLNYIRDHIL